jgi:hypothetical protein
MAPRLSDVEASYDQIDEWSRTPWPGTRDLSNGERADDGASMTRLRRTFTWLTVGVLVLTLVATLVAEALA